MRMKKIVLILIVLVLAAGSVFASQNKLGVTVGPAFGWGFGMADQKYSQNTGATRLLVLLDGVTYFDDDGGLGIDFGVGTLMNIKQWGDWKQFDPIFNSDFNAGLTFRLGLNYKHPLNDIIGVTVGAGFLGTAVWRDSVFLGEGILADMTSFELDVYGEIGVDFLLARVISIEVGVMMSGPVFANYNISSEFIHSWYYEWNGENLELGAFYLTPFLGVSFVF